MKKQSWLKAFVGLPAILASSLPVLACPLCWPAYTALLSAMGLSFFNYTPLLLPLISAFILFALIFFWINSSKTGNYWPLIIGIISGVAVIIGKFLFPSILILGVGILGLIISSIMNFVSSPKKECGSCKIEKK